MKKIFVFLAFAIAMLGFAPASAQTAVASPSPATNIYDDNSVHFAPPKEWQRLEFTPPESGGKLAPVAIYVRNPGHENAQRMLLEMEPFDEPVQAWESNVENELRTQFDGVLIRKENARLENGMPAVWLNLTYGSGFDTAKLYGYAISDGRRGIFIAIQGRLGMIDANESKAAMSSLAVVLYPSWKR